MLDLIEAPEDLGKTGYFPFSWYKNIKLEHVMNAIKREESPLFNEYIQTGLPLDHLKGQILFNEITNDKEITVTVCYGSNEGIYLDAFIFHHDRKDALEYIIVCKTLNINDHTMTRAWQSAGNLYRFLNGWWD